nr:hypothetical protein CFP56_41428 [Quercus suber]
MISPRKATDSLQYLHMNAGRKAASSDADIRRNLNPTRFSILLFRVSTTAELQGSTRSWVTESVDIAVLKLRDKSRMISVRELTSFLKEE